MKDFNMNDMVKLALDNYRGRTEKYSSEDAQESIRKGLIELNNGKTTLDYRAIRDGKCPGLFSFIETVLGATTIEGLQGDEYFNQFVDYRNVAEGDQNLFRVDDSDLFVVSKAATHTGHSSSETRRCKRNSYTYSYEICKNLRGTQPCSLWSCRFQHDDNKGV